jgi:hypothetical protein
VLVNVRVSNLDEYHLLVRLTSPRLHRHRPLQNLQVTKMRTRPNNKTKHHQVSNVHVTAIVTKKLLYELWLRIMHGDWMELHTYYVDALIDYDIWVMPRCLISKGATSRVVICSASDSESDKHNQ